MEKNEVAKVAAVVGAVLIANGIVAYRRYKRAQEYAKAWDAAMEAVNNANYQTPEL